jgi:hypothetical protein
LLGAVGEVEIEGVGDLTAESISQVECEVERIEIKQKDETRSNERSWVWKHYLTAYPYQDSINS